MKTLVSIASVFLMLGEAQAASCSADSEKGATCSIDCAQGQAAVCTRGYGGQDPECRCTGNADLKSVTFERELIVARDLKAAPNSVTTTNINTAINERLAKLRDYKLSRACRREKTGESCRPRQGDIICKDIIEDVCHDTVGKLALAGSPTLSNVEASVAPINWGAMPKDGWGWRVKFKNCSSAQQQGEYSYTKREMVGQKATTTETITYGQEISAKVTYKGVEGGVKFSRNVSVTKAEEQSFQEETSIAVKTPVVVPQMKLLDYTQYWVRRLARIPFSGTAYADGPIVPNLEGISVVSQVLPNIADRRFTFSGFIEDVEVFTGRNAILEKPLTAAECPTPIWDADGELVIDSTP